MSGAAPNSLRYDLLSFDLDGTLVDTAGEIAEAANRTIESFGVARRPVAEITTFIGAGTRELMRRLVERIETDDPQHRGQLPADAVMHRFDEHYAQTVGTTGRPYAGCASMLTRLRAAGVRLACVTNKEQRFAEDVLRATALDGFFDLLIGGDTLPNKKPHASVLLHAVKVLGAAPDRTAHVGDSQTDIEAARNAGVAAWAVPWGYNGGEPIEHAEPERLFRSFDELVNFVLASPRGDH